jgi:hypothetical protein
MASKLVPQDAQNLRATEFEIILEFEMGTMLSGRGT